MYEMASADFMKSASIVQQSSSNDSSLLKQATSSNTIDNPSLSRKERRKLSRKKIKTKLNKL